MNGGGNPNGVFVFQVASALTTTSGRAVILTNGAQAGNVYWQLGSSASLGTTSVMKGTLLAYASITLATGAHLDGRALARTGDVTLAGATIVVPSAVSESTYPVTFTESGLPTGSAWAATLNGVQASSTMDALGFTVATGTYSYSVGAVTGYGVNPSSGSVSVNGGPTGVAIAFTANPAGSYSVIFTESGLSQGTTWSVTLNSVTRDSGTDTIGFTVANGTSTYTVTAASGFTVSPSSGSVSVTGAGVSQAIAFTANGDAGGGGGNHGGTPASGGFPSWGLPVLAILIAGLAVALVAGLIVSRQRRRTSP